ncbi:MAG: NAD(P)(+) transhydrogenase (Re/Si-specific) subunit beta [Acidobacteria bacterium]|nr:NAD(P)(+) transhydrogenase (Re/Si-specific) subunit beta [Acidobacteriota bacterium]
MSASLWIQLAYLLSAVCFILSLSWLSSVPTARRGVLTGVLGMALAVGGTLLRPELASYKWLAVAFVLGTTIGVPMALMPMTAVPQRTALSHAFGALAAALVGTAEFFLHAHGPLDRFTTGALALEVILGFLTFTASLMAFGKLQEILPQRPITFRGQNLVNLGVLAVAVALGVALVAGKGGAGAFLLMGGLALAFGILLIIPIGGADMPTVISLLNSYAGLAAAAMGFVLDNNLLIIAGSLDGSSGLILSIIMCRAMNRSFTNVLFGAFGQAPAGGAQGAEAKSHRSASAEEAASILVNASSVMVVPGYGMAAAQAQHKVRELYDLLTKRGVDVKFAIHPVAGRMPGHMNVLLAEANIPYDALLELEEANAELPQTDVALVIGANDVTNPAARHDKGSPIYGMPIIDTDKARTVMAIKRSMNPGFAGIDNELYYLDRTLMLFGDAKGFLAEVVKEAQAEASGG